MSRPRNILWHAAGLLSLGTGIVGIFLPLLPTVPFLILAAWCFGKGNPVWEARLLAHPRYGPPIRHWRERGAIPLLGKIASIVMLSGSAVGGLLLLPGHWRYIPLGIAVVCGTWIATRPTA